MPTPTITCSECKRTLPWTAHYFRVASNGVSFRKICKDCEARQQRERRQANRQLTVFNADYAALYAAKRLPKQIDGVTDLDVDVIRALLQAQRFTCPLTNRAFQLPTAEDVVAYKGITRWQETLAPEVQGDVPILARIIGPAAHGEWKMGNVIFIVERIAELYNWAGGLANYRRIVEQLDTSVKRVVVPQAGLIFKLGCELREELRQQSIQLHKDAKEARQEEQCETPNSTSSPTDPAQQEKTESAPGPA